MSVALARMARLSARVSSLSVPSPLDPDTRSKVSKGLALALPTASALGSELPVIGPFFGFRLLTVVVVAMALTYPANRDRRALSRVVLPVAITWIGVGALLGLFSLDPTAALRTMLAVILGLVLALACLRISVNEKAFVVWLAVGWVASFVVTGLVASWEVLTKRHLESYFDGPDSWHALPAATLSNPNAYAIYLVGVQGILLWQLSRSEQWFTRVGLAVANVACLAFTALTGSRFCLASSLLLVCVFFALRALRVRPRYIVAALVVVALAWLLIPGVDSTVKNYLPADMIRTTSLESVLSEFDATDSSAGLRVELYKSAVWLLVHTCGLGVGPGNYGAALESMDPPYETGSTLAAHGFVPELLSEFGVIVFIAFCTLMVVTLRRAWASDRAGRALVVGLGLAFVLAGCANSGYLLASSMWMLFATVLCVVATSTQEEELERD